MVLMYRRLSSISLLILCINIPSIIAMSLMKDIAIAAILAGILKPRFVPLPIPIPFKLIFSKHTRKPYPVPVYSHSFQAHQVDGHGWSQYGHNSLDDITQLQHLAGSQALAQLEAASENIDSWVQQLSLSSNALKASESNNIPTLHGDFDELTDAFEDVHGSEGWW
ncbi:uncharacterized protein LOC129966811 [Argiope bruennichi]|uniref:Uncharacterized protein n=1 Tax=Argiope bruennichi TaxID=94029 RepID=A0A8T0E684_ARGBR|nr:uncharacterized protein LOC129966811 [Argiope bruennichi]KAF8766984.1 hypothetical protein HNY73_019998 [Argiope bruennichi]